MKNEHASEPADPDPALYTYTLFPLIEFGPEALDTHDSPGILQAFLCKVEKFWRNPALGVTIHEAKDLFAPGVHALDAVPDQADLLAACFDLYFRTGWRPHRICLRPPRLLRFQYPEDAPIVLPWLGNRLFRRRVAAALRTTVTLLLLILATLLACNIADAVPADDDDDDDSNHHHQVLVVPPTPRSSRPCRRIHARSRGITRHIRRRRRPLVAHLPTLPLGQCRQASCTSRSLLHPKRASALCVLAALRQKKSQSFNLSANAIKPLAKPRGFKGHQ